MSDGGTTVRQLRVALFGSPAFALPTLEALHDHHRLLLVVAQPDKPAGRGLKLSSPATIGRARELGVASAQPRKLRDPGFVASLDRLDLDAAITAAYGKILPQTLLDLPRHGFLNVHASLLPRYRGAAPIQWALINGETETGVTIMQTEAGLDTGPIRHQHTTPIGDDDDALTLFGRLALLGAEALLEALALLAQGRLPSRPQDDAAASLAPMLDRDAGRLRWGDPAQAILNRYRGVLAWPGTWFEHRGQPVKVHGLDRVAVAGPTGTVLAIDDGVTVAAAEGAVRLTEVQPSGRGRMPARAWANGQRITVGDRLG